MQVRRLSYKTRGLLIAYAIGLPLAIALSTRLRGGW